MLSHEVDGFWPELVDRRGGRARARASGAETADATENSEPPATPCCAFTDIEIEQHPSAVLATLYSAMNGIPT